MKSDEIELGRGRADKRDMIARECVPKGNLRLFQIRRKNRLLSRKRAILW